MRSFGYLSGEHADMILFNKDIAALIDRFGEYRSPLPKWLDQTVDELALRKIRIAAAVMDDEAGRLLLVRKADTKYFMQPGGKIEAGENPIAALCRELREEIGLKIAMQEPRYLGCYSADAANEPGWVVEAELFHVRTSCEPIVSGEIAEAIWIEPEQASLLPLAPLTRDQVLPLTRVL